MRSKRCSSDGLGEGVIDGLIMANASFCTCYQPFRSWLCSARAIGDKGGRCVVPGLKNQAITAGLEVDQTLGQFLLRELSFPGRKNEGEPCGRAKINPRSKGKKTGGRTP